ncbi:hypothetical protein T08_12232 [Trichinella sp. T8]|nr:hypothetical protein T08_12232 [Trichinella sp. T8]
MALKTTDTTEKAPTMEESPGIVLLRISSNICTRSLFSLTPNVIGRYRIFNCSMLTPAVIYKRDSSNETGYEKSA